MVEGGNQGSATMQHTIRLLCLLAALSSGVAYASLPIPRLTDQYTIYTRLMVCTQPSASADIYSTMVANGFERAHAMANTYLLSGQCFNTKALLLEDEVIKCRMHTATKCGQLPIHDGRNGVYGIIFPQQ
jgi:hypothetical protein